MKKIMIAAALAATALTATTASAQQFNVPAGPANFTLTTGISGNNVPGSPNSATLTGIVNYSALINGMTTNVTDFNVEIDEVDYNAFNSGISAKFNTVNGSTGTLAFLRGMETLFAFDLAGLFSADNRGATPSGGATISTATSFNYNGTPIDINAGSVGTLRFESAVVTAAPEPATWAMMIVGFGAVGASMRRRKSKVTTNVAFA